MNALIEKLVCDESFQAALQRYAHANGSSSAIVRALLRAMQSIGPGVPPKSRRESGYVFAPQERVLVNHLIWATADWPEESRRNLRDAVIDALDEASLYGIAAAAAAVDAENVA